MKTEEKDNLAGLDFVIDEIMARTDNSEFNAALGLADTLPEPKKTEQRGIILHERALRLKSQP